MSAHNREYPPSGADRWMVCTASVPLIVRLMQAGELKEADLEGQEGIDEETLIEVAPGAYDDVVLGLDEGDSFADEGTIMHSLREICLSFGTDPFDYIGQTFTHGKSSLTITPDLADRLTEGIDWIRSHVSDPLVEVRVDLSPWLPSFGTCDTAFMFEYELIVVDYKNGVGKPVEADGNRQLRIYALGIWHLLGRPETKTVKIVIDQPRAGGLKTWEFPFSELLEFGEELRRVHARIQAGDVEFVPTIKGCQFCPVRKTARGCAAYNMWMVQMMGAAMMDPSQQSPAFKDPAQLSRAHRYYIVQHSTAIRSWLTKLYSESLAAAIAGDPDPGSKAIIGDAGDRYFTDKAEAEAILVRALGADAYQTPKLIGMTQIDRVMKPGRKKQGHPEAWEALQSLVDRKPGTPKLVPAEHPAPAYQKDWDTEFDDL